MTIAFTVELFPAAVRMLIEAGDVIAAAEAAHATHPAAYAVVTRADGYTDSDSYHAAPVGVYLSQPAALHFIGFRGEEYWSAVRIWGLPDFYHRGWDQRAQREIADGDTLVFGPKADPNFVSPWTFDDSNEPDDPAAQERIR